MASLPRNSEISVTVDLVRSFSSPPPHKHCLLQQLSLGSSENENEIAISVTTLDSTSNLPFEME